MNETTIIIGIKVPTGMYCCDSRNKNQCDYLLFGEQPTCTLRPIMGYESLKENMAGVIKTMVCEQLTTKETKNEEESRSYSPS